MADVVDIKTAAPSARLKKLDWSNERAHCKHAAVAVWTDEPILECRDCGAVVDPYRWIRDRCRDWERMTAALEFERGEIKREIDGLKKTLRFLRKEYKDEKERQECERAIAVLPPQTRRA